MDRLDLVQLSAQGSLRIETNPALYHCEADWSWSHPGLADLDLWCVLAGVGTIRLGSVVYALRPGTCLILQPGLPVRAEHDPSSPLTVFACHFNLFASEERQPLPAETLRLPKGAVYGVDLGKLRTLVDLIMEWEPHNALQEQARLHAFWQLILRVVDTSDSPFGHRSDERVGKVLSAINGDLARAWQASQLARIAGLSPSQLNRVFVEQIGVTPIRYLIHRRVEEAKRLISQTSLTVSEVAARLGYSDLFFFSRQFKRYAGYPPRALRQNRSL